MTAVLVMYSVARQVGSYEGDEVAAICSDRAIAERAAAAIWEQDRLATVQITAWLVDVFGPDAHSGVFRGDYTDYTDPDPGYGPTWPTS